MSEPENPNPLRLRPDVIQAIEVFCREQNVSPAEALRTLIEIGLSVYFEDRRRRKSEAQKPDQGEPGNKS